jgi:hypothetical protein
MGNNSGETAMAKSVKCEICGKPIHPLRLEVIPDTKTCVKCSQTEPYSQEDILGMSLMEGGDENRINTEDFEEIDNENY